MSEFFDTNHGVAEIPKNKLNQYLEKYCCKNENELSDTLWLNYGVLLKVF